MIRLAIYFTPRPESQLAITAAQWLGRDTHTESYNKHKPALYISDEYHRQITKSPCHYGFHGTLKPPFKLACGATVALVKERLQNIAKKERKFVLPPLKVTLLDNFFCLRPQSTCRQLDNLAQLAVRACDEYREPPNNEELERRRSAGLTANQEKMLTTWGYPYVMEEFRFHLTLTGRIENSRQQHLVRKELITRFQDKFLEKVHFDHLSLFIEKDRSPLQCIESFPLS